MQCLTKECGKPATRALKVDFYSDLLTPPVTMFISITLCDEHTPSDEEINNFLHVNWEVLKVGMSHLTKKEAKEKLTKWEFRPLEEAEEFWNDGENKAKKVYKQ